jgi:hypothetical protein
LEDAPDECHLDEVAHCHAIDAAMFVPFTIMRLRGDTEAAEAILTVNLRDVIEPGTQHRRLRLRWSAASALKKLPGVQEHTITEWAALGVACAVVWRYAGLHIREVAGRGDRFDYWVADGEREYGLEVSGTAMEELETRHRAKILQLRENPFAVDGYVVVVGFTTQQVIFSFNQVTAGAL